VVRRKEGGEGRRSLLLTNWRNKIGLVGFRRKGGRDSEFSSVANKN